MSRVLIVDDEPDVRRGLKLILEAEGIPAETAPSAEAALERLRHDPFDTVVTDYQLGGMNGIELLREIKRAWPDTGIVVITAYGTIENAVEAMSSGAFRYITKPFKSEEVVSIVRETLEERNLVAELEELRRQLDRDVGHGEFVSQDRQVLDALALLDKVAATPASILLEGESGTGKELLARRVHSRSPRADRRFVAINTGALPDTLLEGELFGHSKGAFTGAAGEKTGYLVAASGGTIFLDEIAGMSASFQAKLLRVLESLEVTPLGSTTPVPVDLRVVCATNRSLGELVEERKFRDDLFFRLNVVHVKIPPLRERPGDVPLLAEHFARRCSEVYGQPEKRFDPSAHRVLAAYAWPGNARELWNVVQRAFLLSTRDEIDAGDIVMPSVRLGNGRDPAFHFGLPYEKAKEQVVASFQKEYLSRLIEACDGNLSLVSRRSGLTRAAIYRIIKKLGLKLP